jgi:hypothetical protein
VTIQTDLVDYDWLVKSYRVAIHPHQLVVGKHLFLESLAFFKDAAIGLIGSMLGIAVTH